MATTIDGPAISKKHGAHSGKETVRTYEHIALSLLSVRKADNHAATGVLEILEALTKM